MKPAVSPGNAEAYLAAARVYRAEAERLRGALQQIRGWAHNPDDTYFYSLICVIQLAGEALDA
jgi:hypothetical protein